VIDVAGGSDDVGHDKFSSKFKVQCSTSPHSNLEHETLKRAKGATLNLEL